MAKEKVVVVGAGLVGSLLAVYLGQRGFEVQVLEHRADPRQAGAKEDRSISVALSSRGLRALGQVGLQETMLALTIPMRGRMIHHTSGPLEYQPYGHKDEEALYAISRKGLVCALISAAEATPGVTIRFGHKVMGVDLHSGEADVRDPSGGHQRIPGPIFGADGAYSAVRASMMRIPPFDLSQSHLDYGYRDVDIPPGPGGTWQIEKNALHIWPRQSFMLIALPKEGGEFAAELFLPMEGTNSFDSLNTAEAVEAFFRTHFPDVYPLYHELGRKFLEFPTGRMVTVRSFPLHMEGKTVLLGDAGHSVVPFFGEGMNSGFEDCRLLDSCIHELGTDWARVFERFTRQRKAHVDAIASMALENFVEMRDSCDNPAFLLRKAVEYELEQRFPGRYLSRHYLVSICGVPYHDAHAAGPVQEAILDQLCQGLAEVSQLNMDLAGRLIDQKLAPLVRSMLQEAGLDYAAST